MSQRDALALNRKTRSLAVILSHSLVSPQSGAFSSLRIFYRCRTLVRRCQDVCAKTIISNNAHAIYSNRDNKSSRHESPYFALFFPSLDPLTSIKDPNHNSFHLELTLELRASHDSFMCPTGRARKPLRRLLAAGQCTAGARFPDPSTN